MITETLINALLERAMASGALLERLETKVDAQTVGKLRGALRSLQTAAHQQEGVALAVQMALNSFTECAEYFRSLIASFESELDFDRKFKRRSKVGRVVGWGQFLKGSVRDLLGLGEGQLNKLLWFEVERIDCINLLILSEVGRIACMAELNFDEKTISRDLDRLCSTDFDVDPDPFMERVVELGMLPSHVTRMERLDFVKHYGAALDYDDLQPSDERREMKAFVIEHYGSTIAEVRKNNPGYRLICRQAGREPNDLDDYVDMVMTCAAEDEGLVDRLEDWAEKKLLYWADKDMMDAWAQAFFRYAALRTLLKTKGRPSNLLSAVASGGIVG